MKRIKRFFKSEKGAAAVEYGLLIALIAAIIVSAVALLGTNLTTAFNYVAGVITTK